MKLNDIIRKLCSVAKLASLNAWQNKRIQRKLQKEYEPIINEYISKTFVPNQNDSLNKHIWLCWLQGYENAPILVQKCLDLLEKNTPKDYDINIITLENYQNFVFIPEYIESKLKSGYISRTHFSDVLRFNLLAKYGGLWVDATMFINEDMKSLLSSYPFLTLKSKKYNKYNTISNGMWTTYFIRFRDNDPTPLFIRDIMHEYWSRYSKSIDYFLLDHFIAIAYNNFAYFRSQVDSLPNNIGDNRFLMNELFNKTINEKDDSKISNDLIGIYKTTYKKKYIRNTTTNQMTYFGRYF